MREEITDGEAKLFEIIKWVFIILMAIVGFTALIAFLGWIGEVASQVNLAQYLIKFYLWRINYCFSC